MILEQLDIESAVAAREAALRRVESNADADWLNRVLAFIEQLAVAQKTVTSDDVWVQLIAAQVASPREPRAMGAAFRIAQRRGLIAPTDWVRPSRRTANHRRPLRVWRSLVDGKKAE